MQIKDKKILFNIVDSRTVRVTGETSDIKVHTADNEITALDLPSSSIITLGSNLTIKNRPYKVNIIKGIKIKGVLYYELHIAKKTKSSLLVLPMLEGERYLYFYDENLVNCFIGTKERGEGTIGLLYRQSNSSLFKKFINAIQKFRNFEKIAKFSDDFIYFELSVPKKYKNDYKKFIEGKYSEFSSNYKDMILKFHKIDIDSQIAQILYKGQTRRKKLEDSLGVSLDPDAELFSVINKDRELFDKNYYL